MVKLILKFQFGEFVAKFQEGSREDSGCILLFFETSLSLISVGLELFCFVFF